MKNIVITGATSFIGLNLLKKLKKNKKNKLHLILRKNSSKKKLLENIENIIIYEVNMEEYKNIDNYLNIIPDCLVHLAWDGVRRPYRDDKTIQEKNYFNSLDLFDKIVKMGCKKIINIGSQAEYGIKNSKIYETDKKNPNSYYGKYKYKTFFEMDKISNELKIKFYHIRIFSIYGENDYKDTLIQNCLEKLKKNEIVQFTEAKQLWNFLNIEDAVNVLQIFIDNDEIETGEYNLASLDTRALKDYILELKEILKSNSELQFGKILDNNNVNINPSIEKIMKKTNWKPQISFREGILKMVNK